jgi:hypothetical protein
MPNTYIAISSITLTSTAQSITFTSIPGTYTDLVVKASGRWTTSAVGAGMFAYPNGNTGGSYYWTALGHDSDGVKRGWKGAAAYIGMINGSGASANSFSAVEFTLLNYAYSGSRAKMFISKYGTPSFNTNQTYSLSGGLYWDGTSAVTSLQLNAESGGTFATGSSFQLYGVLKA